ncbi:unnamed protein product [Medioppia subpectinata]|uniref:C2H2-type domain-containing protein n=1 Tax=Medioppia subpectinata TaxID=1979941 RepID=A0A7R9L411_9ACAR|nr:unnamed protein product [Medioppia subpectinata]CAG2113915.1 unnamed protein product [Medioppia subpectinata]
MSSSDSCPTYESLLESLVVRQKPFKCNYKECHKSFATQSLLDAHKHRKHAVEDITLREPIVSSTDARDQSTTAADDGQQQQSMATTAVPPMVPTITSTSSPDNQSLDNTCDDDSDTDIEIVDTIPALNTGQTLTQFSDQQLLNTSLVDHNPCLNINTNTGHTSADNPLPTTGQTVIDLPTTHICRIDGCGLQFTIEYKLIAHQRVMHKTTAPGVSFRYDTSGVRLTAPVPKRHGCAHNGCGLSFATKLAMRIHLQSDHSPAGGGQYWYDSRTQSYHTKQALDKQRLTVHSAATRVLQTSVEIEVNVPAVVMDTTAADDRLVEPMTVLPVQSITATTDPNNRFENNTPSVPTIATTSCPDSQSLDNTCDDDSDTDIEIVDSIPAVNTGQTLSDQQMPNTSLVDNKPCLKYCLNHNSLVVTDTNADDRPVVPTTVLSVHSITDPNNSDLKPDLKAINAIPEPKSTADVKPLTVHSAAAETLQATIPMDTTVPGDRPVKTTTVPPVQSITATTDPNNSDLKPDFKPELKLIVKPELKYTVDTKPVPATTGHTIDQKYIEISDTSSDENSGLEIVAEYRRDNCGQSLTRHAADGQCQPLADTKVAISSDIKIESETVKPEVSGAHPCGRCTQSFDTVDQWAEHKLTCNRCPKCCVLFVNGFQRIHHMATHHPRSKAPNWLRKATKQVRKHTRVGRKPAKKGPHKRRPIRFRCKQCPMRYTSAVWFAKHMASVHCQPRRLKLGAKPKPFACTKCRKRYLKAETLAKHERTRHSHACHLCDKQFVRAKKLMRHQKCFHSLLPPKSMTCEECGKGFATFNALADHKRDKKH